MSDQNRAKAMLRVAPSLMPGVLTATGKPYAPSAILKMVKA